MNSEQLEAQIKAAHPDGWKQLPGQLTTNQARHYVSFKTGYAPYRTHFVTRCKRHDVKPQANSAGNHTNYYSVTDLDAMCQVMRSKSGRTIAVEVIE